MRGGLLVSETASSAPATWVIPSASPEIMAAAASRLNAAWWKRCRLNAARWKRRRLDGARSKRRRLDAAPWERRRVKGRSVMDADARACPRGKVNKT
jgi:hypothetical protein